MRNRHFAKKTACNNGHTHASKAEAARCDHLHLLQRGREIEGLTVGPVFKFAIEGAPLKMANGRVAQYTPDFTYSERGKLVAEDVKAKNGFVERDVPLRFALFRHLYPDWELRVVTG